MQFISDSKYYTLSTQEDPANFRSDDSGVFKSLDDIVTDYSKLVDPANPAFLDGSVVQFFQVGGDNYRNGNQMVFTPSGGQFNQGYLQYTKNISNDESRKFVLEWYNGPDGSGYYMWPNNNSDSRKMLLFAGLPDPKKDNADARVSAAYSSTPKGTEQAQRLFKFTNRSSNAAKKLITGLSITSPKVGPYTIGVDTQSNVTSRKAPSPQAMWEVKFIKLGTNAWMELMKDTDISYLCCARNQPAGAFLSQVDNFLTACDKMSLTADAAACSIAFKTKCPTLGFQNKMCKAWCIKNPADCNPLLTTWCKKPANAAKPECVCFDEKAFKKFEDTLKSKCKKDCPLPGEFVPGCFYPPCMLSDMKEVHKVTQPCLDPDTVLQKCLTDIKNVNVDVGEDFNVFCNLSSSGGDGLPKSLPRQGTPGRPGGTSTTTQPVSSAPPQPSTQPPMTSTPQKPKTFWQQYKWVIIGVIIAMVVLLLAFGFYMYMSTRAPRTTTSPAPAAPAAETTHYDDDDD